MSIKETLDSNKNSIELALVNFLKSQIKNTDKIDESALLKMGATIVKEIPFASYLELGYALDEFDEKNPNSDITMNSIPKMHKILIKNKRNIVNSLVKGKEEDDKLKTIEPFVDLIIKYISQVRESIKISFYSKTNLNEMNQPKYHYTAIMPKEIMEKITNWLDEQGINHFITEMNEFVVECNTRDSLYAFDKFLSRTIERENFMVDFKISEAKKRPQDMTNLDLARLKKPRLDPSTLPKMGAFDKDIKGQIKKKNPADRRAMKHKGKVYATEEKFVLDEAVLGMTGIPFISRLQTLAGLETTEMSDPVVENDNDVADDSDEFLEIMQELDTIERYVYDLTPTEISQVISRMMGIIESLK